MSEKTLSVTGMSCTGCEQNVEDALSELDGVGNVEADHESDSVSISLEGSVDDAAIRDAIEEAGYQIAGAA